MYIFFRKIATLAIVCGTAVALLSWSKGAVNEGGLAVKVLQNMKTAP